MTPDPYRRAYEKAVTDLTDIAAAFEKLSNRKKNIENLIVALEAISTPQHTVPANSSVVEMPLPQASHEAAVEGEKPEEETEHRFSFLDVPAPLPPSDGDPFERRVKANFRFKGIAAQR